LRFFELRNLMIGAVVLTLTLVIRWLLGIGSSVPPVAGKPERAQMSSMPGPPARP
jgi:hypothetical protein